MMPSILKAQLTTSSAAPYNTATHLVNNVLMGNGVQGYNISSYGAVFQRGFFDNGTTAIGMDSGIVMSSGSIANIPTSSGFGASTAIFPNTATQGGGDADLLAVAQSVPGLIGQSFSVNSTWDACIIEFDFVPLSDTVEFDYVFGSEEYLTWINSPFNDVFGFFLSGPGITGPYSSSAINVATVPNTTPPLPISISTIHPTLNGTYYNSGNVNIAYNGYTDVMTAVLEVQACDTFHMKLGIADGSDKILDTGVFLEGSSFEAVGIIVEPSPSYNPFGNDTALYEGCGDVTIYFTRNDSALLADSLSYEVWGDATMSQFNTTNGDYSHIVNTAGSPCVWNPTTQHWMCELYFAAGEETDSITFDVFYDNLTEGFESLIIAITDSVELGCTDGDTIELNIIDQPDLIINAFGDVTLDCADDSALIGVNVNSGLPPFTFTWDNGHDDSIQNVLPPFTTSYVVTVEDACGQQQETDFVNISIFNVPWSSVKIGDNQTISCISPPVDIGVGVVFNDGIWHGDISYEWSTGSTDSMISVFSTVDTTYSITITRNCTGEEVVHNFNLYTYNDPVITATKDVPESFFDCPEDTTTIKVSTSGGYPPYTFNWSTGSVDSTTLVGPELTSTFYVTVNDVCGLVDYVDSVVVEMPVADPLEILNIKNDTVPCENVYVTFGPAYPKGGFGWGYAFSWNNFETFDDTYKQILFETDTFTIWLTDGCRTDTISKDVYGVVSDKNMLDLFVSNDTLVCFGDEIILEAQAVEGVKEYFYEWEHGPRNPHVLVRPDEATTYTVRVTDQCDTTRTASVFVDVAKVEASFAWEYINDYEVALTNTSTSNKTMEGYVWESREAGLVSYETDPIIPMPDGNPYMVQLTAIDEYGCSDFDTVVVSPTHHLYIPTGFTPNNDGKNDTWSVSGLGIREIRVEIYNRWGETLYYTDDKNFEWDGTVNGKRLPMGAYSFRLVLITDTGEFVEKRGVVNLLNDFTERDE
jgi:gliding motility-associated-like protein